MILFNADPNLKKFHKDSSGNIISLQPNISGRVFMKAFEKSLITDVENNIIKNYGFVWIRTGTNNNWEVIRPLSITLLNKSR